MRRAAAVDANQEEIVRRLRGAGALVQHLNAVGSGCPDILVGFKGHLVLMEIKDGRKPKSARQLTEAQVEWHRQWAGFPIFVVESSNDALSVLHSYCWTESLVVQREA